MKRLLLILLAGCSSRPAPAVEPPQPQDDEATQRCEAIGAALEAVPGNFEGARVEGTQQLGEELEVWDTTLEMPGAKATQVGFDRAGSGRWRASFDPAAHSYDGLVQELARCEVLRGLESREDGRSVWEHDDGRSVWISDLDGEIEITVFARR